MFNSQTRKMDVTAERWLLSQQSLHKPLLPKFVLGNVLIGYSNFLFIRWPVAMFCNLFWLLHSLVMMQTWSLVNFWIIIDWEPEVILKEFFMLFLCFNYIFLYFYIDLMCWN
jgi:hypothetical protein